MATQLSRIQPRLGPEAYKSYSWQQPLHSHFRRVTCAEYRCASFKHGWVTTVDTATELGRRQYDYITHDRSRSCREERSGTSLVSFTFGPGHEYFAGDPKHEHYRPIGREPLLTVSGGDWRGNPRGARTIVHRNAEDWISDFAEHQDRLARAQR